MIDKGIVMSKVQDYIHECADSSTKPEITTNGFFSLVLQHPSRRF